MRLPEDDEDYLNDKGFRWEMTPAAHGAYLVIRDFSVCTSKYERARTDLMLMIPSGYNNAQLDMFWVDPPLLLGDGRHPPNADLFEDHMGRRWQRFSRHLSSWHAGIDGLPMFLALIQGELQERSG